MDFTSINHSTFVEWLCFIQHDIIQLIVGHHGFREVFFLHNPRKHCFSSNTVHFILMLTHGKEYVEDLMTVLSLRKALEQLAKHAV